MERKEIMMEAIVGDNFSKLTKLTAARRSVNPSRLNTKKIISSNHHGKLLKTGSKGKVFRAARNKSRRQQQGKMSGTPVRQTADFSGETVRTEGSGTASLWNACAGQAGAERPLRLSARFCRRTAWLPLGDLHSFDGSFYYFIFTFLGLYGWSVACFPYITKLQHYMAPNPKNNKKLIHYWWNHESHFWTLCSVSGAFLLSSAYKLTRSLPTFPTHSSD